MKEIVQFFKEVRIEFSKVVWPKTSEFVGTTIIVLVLVLFFSLYLTAVDTLCTKSIGAIFRVIGL